MRLKPFFLYVQNEIPLDGSKRRMCVCLCGVGMYCTVHVQYIHMLQMRDKFSL